MKERYTVRKRFISFAEIKDLYPDSKTQYIFLWFLIFLVVSDQIAAFNIFYTVFVLKHVGNVPALSLIIKDRRMISEITCATLCSNRVCFGS